MPISIERALVFSEDSYTRATYCVNDVECDTRLVEGIKIVSFRGTETDSLLDKGGWRDILRDIRFFPWYDERVGWSHAGFLKGARGVVDSCLTDTLLASVPTVIVGHSLGGALALNAAAILAAEGVNIVGCVTFGAPRTFIRGTVRRFTVPTWQFSNPNDPITHVPHRFWGYRHVNEVDVSWPANGLRFSNHAMSAYMEALL